MTCPEHPLGTRVQHADGATGTITGTTRYITGHTVPLVHWDDGSSSRIGPVTKAAMSYERDHHMRQFIARLNCRPGDISAVNMDSSGGRSCEHPGGKQPAGGGMDGMDWWRLYLASPDRTITLAEQILEEAHGPKERPAGETLEQEVARKSARVLDLHADGGWTTHDMARDVGLTIGQVSKVIMGAAISRKLDASDRRDAVEVMRLWREDQGRTVRYLAAATGVPKSTVQDILRRAA